MYSTISKFLDVFSSKKSISPDWWYTYKHGILKLDKSLPIENAQLVVFDSETTGLNPAKDVLLSLGAVKVNNGRIEAERTFEFNFYNSIPNKTNLAVPIHGLLKNSGDTPLEVGIAKFVEFIGNAVLVGHHVGFDMAVLNNTIKKITGDTLKNETIDTGFLAHRLEILEGAYYHGALKKSLDELCKLYDIDMHDRHTAAGDALLTAFLFLKLASRLKKRNIKTLADFLRLSPY